MSLRSKVLAIGAGLTLGGTVGLLALDYARIDTSRILADSRYATIESYTSAARMHTPSARANRSHEDALSDVLVTERAIADDGARVLFGAVGLVGYVGLLALTVTSKPMSPRSYDSIPPPN